MRLESGLKTERVLFKRLYRKKLIGVKNYPILKHMLKLRKFTTDRMLEKKNSERRRKGLKSSFEHFYGALN